MAIFPGAGLVLGFLFVGVLYLRKWLTKRPKPSVPLDLVPEDEPKVFTEPVYTVLLSQLSCDQGMNP
jgi:hypothetical protein